MRDLAVDQPPRSARRNASIDLTGTIPCGLTTSAAPSSSKASTANPARAVDGRCSGRASGASFIPARHELPIGRGRRDSQDAWQRPGAACAPRVVGR